MVSFLLTLKFCLAGAMSDLVHAVKVNHGDSF